MFQGTANLISVGILHEEDLLFHVADRPEAVVSMNG